MTTQTLKTIAPTGITSAKANTRGVDALATNGNSASVSYGSTNTNLLTVTWTDLAAGDYDVIFFVGAVASYYDVLRVSGTTAILLGDRTTAELDSAVETQIDNIEEIVESFSESGEISISSPVVETGADGLPVKVEIVQGADYLLADSTQIAMTLTGTFPAWTAGSAYLDILCGGVELSLTGVITTATGGTRALYFELTAAQSVTLVDATKNTPSQDVGVFDLRVVLSNGHVTYPINRGAFVSRRRSQV